MMPQTLLKNSNPALQPAGRRGIAARSLVIREDDCFRVTLATSDGQKTDHRVWRDVAGKVRCSCLRYQEHSIPETRFRCEHILAVKQSLLMKNSESTHTEETEIETSEVSSEMPKNVTIEASCDPEPARKPHAKPVPLTFNHTLRSLRRQVDANTVRRREGWRDRSGAPHVVEYVEWHRVADILDRVTPTWSHSVKNVVQIGAMVAVTVAITIEGITREGVGTGPSESEMGIKKAEHDALKRAAVKFGIARNLYQREIEAVERKKTINAFAGAPLAKSMSDLVTPRQLGMIRALGRETGLSVEDECNRVLGCKTDELSRAAASSLIDHLQAIDRQDPVGDEMRRAS